LLSKTTAMIALVSHSRITHEDVLSVRNISHLHPSLPLVIDNIVENALPIDTSQVDHVLFLR
jgi:hypothetical protein